MKQYTIKEVEELTGIKAHTLRIWEKRYHILPCTRSDTKIRYYTDAGLKRLINIAMLLEKGSKISRVSCMSEEEMHEAILRVADFKCDENSCVDRLTTTMLEMDEVKFTVLINDAIAHAGFLNTVTKIIYPFLNKIGVMWQTGALHPAQEHFISHLIRQKLMAETDKLPPVTNEKGIFVLFLPAGELHDIGLLFYNYYLRLNHYKVIYLGAGVPIEDLKILLKQQRADYMLTYFITCRPKKEMQDYLFEVENHFHGNTIYAAGLQCKQMDCGCFTKVKTFSDFEKFREIAGI